VKTHRENLEDIIRPLLHEFAINDIDMVEASINITDAVFDALSVTGEEQSKTGGYFMLHAGSSARKHQGNLFEGVSVSYDESGKFSSTVLTSRPNAIAERKLVEWEDQLADDFVQRSAELLSGAKYTSSEFKAFASAVKIKDSENGTGWYVSLQTPICKYGQAYDKDIVLEEAKTNFVKGYYNMYLADYERGKDIAEMDKE
jgi:hypothetical protein